MSYDPQVVLQSVDQNLLPVMFFMTICLISTFVYLISSFKTAKRHEAYPAPLSAVGWFAIHDAYFVMQWDKWFSEYHHWWLEFWAVSLIFTADEPERLRGKQHMRLWADEMASWRYGESWDQAKFGLRLGDHPKAIITTTPRPVKNIKDLVKDRATIVTRGTTYDNRANLAPTFFEEIVKRYEGTRLGRQELNAEILEDVPGALWTREMITHLPASALPPMKRIVVAIDPPATSNESSNEAGIIVDGLGEDGRAYVLADRSGVMTPREWAVAAVTAFREFEADRIVAEVNQGGEMVEQVVRSVDAHVPFKAVRASRGKYTRAEPISALYARGLVDHVGQFEALEDQMCSYTPDFDRSNGSPDRLDAHVWAMSDLFPSMVSDQKKTLIKPTIHAKPAGSSLGWMSR